MNLEDLEELLSDYISDRFHIETNKKGEIVIYTGLKQDEDGELIDLKGDLEEDPDFSEEEFEPLEEEDNDIDDE